MDQEGHYPANKRKKIEESEIAQDSMVQNKDISTVDKSVCSSVVDLTDDAWLLVFGYIGLSDRMRIARVCRRWRELARISWKFINRLSFDSMNEPEHLNYFYGNKFTDSVLDVLLQKCGPRLRCLDFTRCYGDSLTSHALDLVGRYCTSLQELILPYMNVKPTAMESLLKKLLKLRSLDLESCNHVSIGEEELSSALKMLQSLKSLNVTEIYHLTGSLFSQAPSSLTEVIAPFCTQLKDSSIRLLAERCPNLETIDINYCRNLSGQSITFLANNCRKLKRFEMIGSISGSDSRLTEHFLTLSNLPLLEVLFVDYHKAVTDEIFSELGRHCPLLRTISCARCQELTDAAIHHLSPCLHLETIDLSYCHRITGNGLIQLSSAHSQLKSVAVECCSGISDEGVGRLLSDHPNLLGLTISDCPLVTDGVVSMLQSSLQRREHTEPLEIWLKGTSVRSEMVSLLRKNTKLICCPILR